MKIGYYTLGCKVSKYETDAMTEIMEQHGAETVDFAEKADYYIINTCTVTAVADKKSRQMISRAVQNGGRVIVCGCMVQTNADEILNKDGVSAVVGTDNRSRINEVIEKLENGEDKISFIDTAILKKSDYETMTVVHNHERTRANIKVEDGCDMFCSYCIIPFARGPVRSRPLNEIVDEVRKIADLGTREVILTGIHVSSYGKDLENVSFINILEELQKIDNLKRIRLSSLEPSLLKDEFCRRASELDKVCPHFHVSLQSGCDTVLKRMNRKYTTAEYHQYIDNLRKYFDNPAITTDVIAGFQGETDEEHESTKKFLQDILFAKLHVFPFSKRKGTFAYNMKGDVPMAVKKERTNDIIALGDIMANEYARQLIGKKAKVLLETPQEDGTCEGYIERYLKTYVPGNSGEIKEIMIKDAKESILISEVL